jgi:hypothetical protein
MFGQRAKRSKNELENDLLQKIFFYENLQKMCLWACVIIYEYGTSQKNLQRIKLDTESTRNIEKSNRLF